MLSNKKIISRITATGSYLPKNIVTNDDIAKIINKHVEEYNLKNENKRPLTNHEWIITRTGINQRNFVNKEGELTSDLATKAAMDAIKSSNTDINTIDGIIVATVTPDLTFPSVASMVQGKLGIKNGFAFDVEAACAGFLVGLATAEGLIATGRASKVLVIGAEVFSKILDYSDPNSVLFGDGAGAVILEKAIDDGSGIISVKLKTDGEQVQYLKSTGGVVSTNTSGHIQMNGPEVFRQAVLKLTSILDEVLSDVDGLTQEDIDFLIPHQANMRIIEAMQKKLGLPAEKVILTIAEHANTSAASIPLALDVAVKSNKIKKGDFLIFEGIGAGLTWGAIALKW
ncbi:beta-ketoacyl-ACP synthase III [Rickettsiales bacterium LUAb2]